MRVFLSWSGQQSRQVALLLKSWIPRVLQSADVYMSEQDIAAGERWLLNVSTNLADHEFGFTILTQTNLNAPWIQFEAGALSKSLQTSRLIPILCGVENISPLNPLSQFQYIKGHEKEQILRAITAINTFSERPLLDALLKESFDKWYPDFEAEYSMIDLSVSDAPPQPTLTGEDIANLLMNMVREMKSIRADIESQRSRDRVAQALINAPNRGRGLGAPMPDGDYSNSFDWTSALQDIFKVEPRVPEVPLSEDKD